MASGDVRNRGGMMKELQSQAKRHEKRHQLSFNSDSYYLSSFVEKQTKSPKTDSKVLSLRRMQNRNFLQTFFDNLIFIPLRLCAALCSSLEQKFSGILGQPRARLVSVALTTALALGLVAVIAISLDHACVSLINHT